MTGVISVNTSKSYKTKITVSSWENAFDMVIALFGDMTSNHQKSEGAGYDIFDLDNGLGWVSDLNTRFEVNFYSGKTINIWITD